MKTLWDTFKENVCKRSLFEEIIDIDFYDGPTEAVCRLTGSLQWCICSLTYIDFESRERIYTVLEINQGLTLKLKSDLEDRLPDRQDHYEKIKAQIEAIYRNYNGKVFLFKSDWLNSLDYEVVEIPLVHLQYFKGIEQVLGQSNEMKLKWKKLFLSKRF